MKKAYLSCFLYENSNPAEETILSSFVIFLSFVHQIWRLNRNDMLSADAYIGQLERFRRLLGKNRIDSKVLQIDYFLVLPCIVVKMSKVWTEEK